MGDQRQGDMCSSRHKDGGETQGNKDAGVAEGWDGTQRDGMVLSGMGWYSAGWDGTQRDGMVSAKNSSTYYSCAFHYMTLGNLQS